MVIVIPGEVPQPVGWVERSAKPITPIDAIDGYRCAQPILRATIDAAMIDIALMLSLLSAVLARWHRRFSVLSLAGSTAIGVSMNLIVNFISLRPVWTRRGLEAVWYAWVIATLLDLGWLFNFLYLPNVTVSHGYGFSLIYSTLLALVRLALVRIFLEMALKFLVAPSEDATRGG